MRAEAIRDATAATLVLLAAVVVGSGGLAHFDPALGGYFVAVVASFFVAVRRVSLFWRRPSSSVFGRELLAALRRPRSLFATAGSAARDLAAQRFIARRGRLRGLAHLCLSWGTIVGFAVTLPLVFGWLRFEAAGPRLYRAVFLSIPVSRFDVDGAFAWLVFHALHLSAVAVIAGASHFVAVRLREGAAGAFHLAPLVLLLAVALSGLALPLAASLRTAWVLRAAEIAHEATVVMLLAALPYGKLLHVFIRPLQLGSRSIRRRDEVACLGCGGALGPQAQVEAIEAILAARGFDFAGHPRLCPGCRRRRVSSAQARLLEMEFQPRAAASRAREAA
jgi:hypothetical protein